MTALDKEKEVKVVLALLSGYCGRELADGEETRRLTFTQIGVSSLSLASVIVELEDRLDRAFDYESFAGMYTVGGLLHAIGLG